MMGRRLLRYRCRSGGAKAVKGGAEMRSIVATVLIILATIHCARAADAPTDRDLQVGYCVGVGKVQLEKMQVTGSPAIDQMMADARARNQHYILYLTSRGYVGATGPRMRMLLPAMGRGEADVHEIINVGNLCVSQCKSAATLAAASQCYKKCQAQHMSEAKTRRIAACDTLDQDVPF